MVFGSFRKLGVPYFGILKIKILLYLGYYIRVPYFRKLPYRLFRVRVGRELAVQDSGLSEWGLAFGGKGLG